MYLLKSEDYLNYKFSLFLCKYIKVIEIMK